MQSSLKLGHTDIVKVYCLLTESPTRQEEQEINRLPSGKLVLE